MKKTSVLLCMLYVTCVIAWGETVIVDDETISRRLEISSPETEIIVLRNSRFAETVVISGNENLKMLIIYNCNFADIVTIKDNPALTTLSIGSGNFGKHLLVNNNSIDGDADFIDIFINGYFQFSNNRINGECDISLSRIDGGISCFENTFSSIFQINVTNIVLRSVLYGNRFNTLEFNDASFGELTMQNNYLERSMGFADSAINANLTIRNMHDAGDPDSRRSISFFATRVYGSAHFFDIDENIYLLDLWQLDFYQDIFIDYRRLTDSIGLITERIVHSLQSIETVVITNPYKELGDENAPKFNQFISRIKSGYNRRGEREAKIDFYKWEHHYKNSFNNPVIRILNTIAFYASFELFLNIRMALIVSLLICIAFMFVYCNKRDKKDEHIFLYLKMDPYERNYFKRYSIALLVSTSVFFNLPMATKKLREDKAKNVAWIQGMIGMVMLIIIGAIIGRIASI